VRHFVAFFVCSLLAPNYTPQIPMHIFRTYCLLKPWKFEMKLVNSNVYRMFTVCLPYVYRMFTECLPYVYRMFTECLPLFTVNNVYKVQQTNKPISNYQLGSLQQQLRGPVFKERNRQQRQPQLNFQVHN